MGEGVFGSVDLLRSPTGDKICRNQSHNDVGADQVEVDYLTRKGWNLYCNDNKTCILMPYFGEQNLDQYVKEKNPADHEKLAIFLKVFRALHENFHLQGLSHGELNLKNIIIRNKGDPVIIVPNREGGKT